MFIKYTSIICFCISFTFGSFSQTTENYFLSQPSLSPDGKTAVFSFEGDIWKINLSDGKAARLTGMQGYENNAKISPDGKWIAFTGRQSGNPDVFIIPINGGDIKQLTYYSGTDEVASWSWDSKTIYFTSNRLSRISTYKVSIDGGTAVPVFQRNFFLNDHNVFEHPLTGELFFNDTWESSNQASRKGYRGAALRDLRQPVGIVVGMTHAKLGK